MSHQLPSAAATEMQWGIKQSFSEYFTRLPDHLITTTEGADHLASGLLTFPVASTHAIDRDTAATLSFTGRAHLSAHFGAISILIADPQLSASGESTWDFSAVVDEDDDRTHRMNIGAARIGDIAEHDDGITVRFDIELAAEGQFIFMGRYPEGESMDPISMTFATTPHEVAQPHPCD